ncbi:MAG: PfkB family carbohydrate kinase [Methylococcales bacterium]|nr:PfkB family carbohydrate kinase [Methylococcales bacterium]
MKQNLAIDVLCVGHASYDFIFTVDYHPKSDEKVFANDFLGCGGGPAANAAVQIARLGGTTAFAGYLGKDLYGEKHLQEFIESGVDSSLIIRGNFPTPLSTILVKPDGERCLINYKGQTQPLLENTIDFSHINPTVILLDGHEPDISLPLAENAQKANIPIVLDAGSLNPSTYALLSKVDYAVCSEKFALQLAGNVEVALQQISDLAPTVVITLGEKGLIWKKGNKQGKLNALIIDAIDTTGAGDAFHGAFAYGVAVNMDWDELLIFSSVAGSLCCQKMGARLGLANLSEMNSACYQYHDTFAKSIPL